MRTNPKLDAIAGDFDLDKRYIQLVEKTNTYYPNAFQGSSFFYRLQNLETEIRPQRRYRYMPALGHLGCLGGLPFHIEVIIEPFTGIVATRVHYSLDRYYWNLGGYKKHAETFGWVTEDMAGFPGSWPHRLKTYIQNTFRDVGRDFAHVEHEEDISNGALSEHDCDMIAEYRAMQILETVYDVLNKYLSPDWAFITPLLYEDRGEWGLNLKSKKQ